MLLLVALAPYVLSLGFVRSRIKSEVSSNLRGNVEIEAVSWSWFSGVSIEGLRIDNPPGFPTERPAISVKNLTADVSLRSLLFGSVTANADIVGLEINVEQAADGTTNLQELAPESDDKDADKPKDSKEPQPDEPDGDDNKESKQVQFDVRLRDCVVNIRKEGKLLEALTEFSCHAQSPADSDKVLVDANGKLQAGDLTVHALHDPSIESTEAKLITHGLDLASWQPLLHSFLPDQISVLTGKVNGEITANMQKDQPMQIGGELLIDGPRIAGAIVQGMNLHSKQWQITPKLSLGSGENAHVDASQFAIDMEWLTVRGKPSTDPGKLTLAYDLDVATVAEFGGPIPELLKGTGSQLAGELRLPMGEMPKDAAGWAKAIAATANVKMTTLDVGGFALRNVGVDVSMQDGAMTLGTTPSTQMDGGALVASIQVDLNDFARMPTNATIKWNGGKLTGGATQGLRYLMPLFSGLDADVAQVAGDVNLELNFNGPAMKTEGQELMSWLDGWSGNGSLGLANTKFAPSSQLSGLLSPLGTLSNGALPIADKGQLKLDSFRTPFEFAKGLISTKSAEWEAAGQKFGLSGNIGFDGKVDYQIDLTALLSGHKDGQKALKALNGKLPPASLAGTVDQPSLGLPKVGDLATKLLEQKGKDLLQKGLKKGLKDLFKK